MRIAIGGLHVECSSYNPVPTRTEDFRILRGEALTDHPDFRFTQDMPFTAVPLLHARAIPGGPVPMADYLALKTEFLARLAEAGPLDAVYLAMHGAMYVAGMEDAEGDFITSVRQSIGPKMPIAVSYDLHGNLSQRIIDQIDIYATYRTAPHIDEEATQIRALAMLLQRLETDAPVFVMWAPVPVLLSGECSSTRDEPARGLYAGLPELARHGVWDVSVNVGYVWVDEPRAGASVVVTGTDPDVMQRVVRHVAQSYWDARHDFGFGRPVANLDRAVEIASCADRFPFVLADSGDNPTGGGVGDRAEVFGRLIAAGIENAIVAGIADPAAVVKAQDLPLGAQMQVTIGAGLDPQGSDPVAITGVMRYRDKHAIVLQVKGISVVLTAKRLPFHRIADFTRLGLDPHSAQVLVVKSGYLEPDIAALAGDDLMILTAGAVDQDIVHLRRERLEADCYPWVQDFDYVPLARSSARRNGSGCVKPAP